jgi:hypothetical protein
MNLTSLFPNIARPRIQREAPPGEYMVNHCIDDMQLHLSGTSYSGASTFCASLSALVWAYACA